MIRKIVVNIRVWYEYNAFSMNTWISCILFTVIKKFTVVWICMYIQIYIHWISSMVRETNLLCIQSLLYPKKVLSVLLWCWDLLFDSWKEDSCKLNFFCWNSRKSMHKLLVNLKERSLKDFNFATLNAVFVMCTKWSHLLYSLTFNCNKNYIFGKNKIILVNKKLF